MPKLNPLRLYLLENGITQKALAYEANIAASALSYIVNGRMFPTDKQKRRIAKALDVDVNILFPEKNP
jgi:transcriptional regulator with XRE-family HTH domain